MTISPCAMLMTPMTPKVMARPMAASSRTEPSEMPYQMFCPADQSARDALIVEIAADAACFSGPSALASKAVSNDSASRLPLRGDEIDGRELVGLRKIGNQHRRKRGPVRGGLDARHLLLGDGRVEAAMEFGIRRLEHGLGGGDARRRVLRAKRQRAQRIADDAAQRVVDLDFGDFDFAASPAAAPVSGSASFTV